MKYLIQSIFDVVNFEGKEYYTTKTILKKGISQKGQLISALGKLPNKKNGKMWEFFPRGGPPPPLPPVWE